eukprot:6183381-Pleurochrysis_carterae.AAC.4
MGVHIDKKRVANSFCNFLTWMATSALRWSKRYAAAEETIHVSDALGVLEEAIHRSELDSGKMAEVAAR